MRNQAYQPRKTGKEIRGFANNLVTQRVTNNAMQQAADHSAHVQQIQQYQQMANQPVIQCYKPDKEGRLVSNDKHAVLEDGTKNLYLTNEGLDKANTELANKGNNMINLNGEPAPDMHNRKYQKITTTFGRMSMLHQKNSYGSLLSKKGHEEGITELNKPEPGIDPFLADVQRLINKISFLSGVELFGKELSKVEMKIKDRKTLEASLEDLKRIQKDFTAAGELLAQVSSLLLEENGREQIIELLTTHQIAADNIGEHLRERIYIYCKTENEIDPDTLLQEVTRRQVEIQKDLDLYETDVPYLPTDCRQLQLLLTNGSKGQSNGGEIGDYHEDLLTLPQEKDTDNAGPWNYHYATIIFKDGADTVTLEDAARQGTFREKSHWYYKMYGEKGTDQGFKERTEKDYEDRRRQRLRYLQLNPDARKEHEENNGKKLVFDTDQPVTNHQWDGITEDEYMVEEKSDIVEDSSGIVEDKTGNNNIEIDLQPYNPIDYAHLFDDTPEENPDNSDDSIIIKDKDDE